MYNSIVIIVMILLLFALSSDPKFSKVFGNNRGAQLGAGLVLLYFAANGIDFGVLLVAGLALAVRYSYLNKTVIAPLAKKSRTLKGVEEMIERFVDHQDELEPDPEQEFEEESPDIKRQNEQLRQLFDDLDKKIMAIKQGG